MRGILRILRQIKKFVLGRNFEHAQTREAQQEARLKQVCILLSSVKIRIENNNDLEQDIHKLLTTNFSFLFYTLKHTGLERASRKTG